MARPPGAPNIVTAEVREVFAKAFHRLQLDEGKPHHLVTWAQANPKEFYAIASKLIPVQMSGIDNKPLIPDTININLRKPSGA